MTDIIEGGVPPERSVELDRGGKNVPGAVVVKASHYIIGGFALTAALAWNNSIRENIKQKFPIPEDNARANLIFAVIITIVLVVIIYILPDTKTELPDDTRKKVQLEQERYRMKTTIIHQKKKLADLEREMMSLRSEIRASYNPYPSMR